MSISVIINRLDSNVRLLISFLVAASIFFYLYGSGTPPVYWMSSWIGFCICHLTFAWITILTCKPTDQSDLARKQDAGRMVTFIFILVSALVSLLAVVLLFRSTKDLKDADLTRHVILTITSVFLTWWLLHTNFTFKYAHLFYISADKTISKTKGSRGLDFPGDEKPDYLDFTYFSFVIGTTFQVSDVAICSKRIRRLVFVHGVISFGFNTTVVALLINIISGLIK